MRVVVMLMLQEQSVERVCSFCDSYDVHNNNDDDSDNDGGDVDDVAGTVSKGMPGEAVDELAVVVTTMTVMMMTTIMMAMMLQGQCTGNARSGGG